jgi:tyrosine decarboxylase / aspartate 1-decarboxylase
MNIVTIQSQFITEGLVKKFDLVPQKHNGDNSWYKIVIMDHVEVDHLSTFISDLKESLYVEKSITNEV